MIEKLAHREQPHPSSPVKLPRDINDFVPLISVSIQRFARAFKTLRKDEASSVQEGNRIYYFSSRLKIKPAIVAKHFSTHMFIFSISFGKLKETLELMLHFGIPSENILKDLWSFIRPLSTTRTRLELCEKSGKGNLKPWVITCEEDKLRNSLTLTEDRLSLLGDGTVVDYLSQRLGYDLEMTKAIVTRYKAVTKVRVAKVR